MKEITVLETWLKVITVLKRLEHSMVRVSKDRNQELSKKLGKIRKLNLMEKEIME